MYSRKFDSVKNVAMLEYRPYVLFLKVEAPNDEFYCPVYYEL